MYRLPKGGFPTKKIGGGLTTTTLLIPRPKWFVIQKGSCTLPFTTASSFSGQYEFRCLDRS